jgi:hydrogenase maturation protease
MMVKLKDPQGRVDTAKPILIFGYGNLSRGDDALGPLLLEYLSNKIDSNNIEILTDFQLQIEHALDLENRQLVLFIDAAVNCKAAFNFTKLQAVKDKSYSTHAMSPTAVLQVYQEITKQQPPPSFLLSIQGVSFELGEDLSQQAKSNLQQAIQFTEKLLEITDVNLWNHKLENSFA